jgi:hypothetical protein
MAAGVYFIAVSSIQTREQGDNQTPHNRHLPPSHTLPGHVKHISQPFLKVWVKAKDKVEAKGQGQGTTNDLVGN